MKVYVGADHGGFEYKQHLISALKEADYDVTDLGANTLDPDDDYPQFAFAVAEAVVKDTTQNQQAVGVLLCRSGGGVTIAANKVAGIRAVQARDEKEVEHARQQNNANVLALSGDWLDVAQIIQLTKLFIETTFSNEARHARRVAQIEKYES